MKKSKKQCLGLFGLSLVVAMTAIAASMPAPRASAVSSTITDTITVRVVGSVPDVNIRDIVNDAVYVDPERVFAVDYENIETMVVSLKYTDAKGNITETVLDETAPDYSAGARDNISINMDDYGYGKYAVSVKGIGYDGVYDEDNVVFYYLPVYAKAEIDDITGKHYVNMEYATHSGDTGASGVAKILVNVYGKDGELIKALSPIEVLPPATKVEIPFAEKEMPSGTYTISVLAYGIDGDGLYKPYVLTTEYKEATVPDAGTPDTGGLFQSLNISKEDYLVSGLIVFFVLGIVAFGIVARNKKSGKKHHR